MQYITRDNSEAAIQGQKMRWHKPDVQPTSSPSSRPEKKQTNKELMCYYSNSCPPLVCFLLRNSGLSGPKMHFIAIQTQSPVQVIRGEGQLNESSLHYSKHLFKLYSVNFQQRLIVARWSLSHSKNPMSTTNKDSSSLLIVYTALYLLLLNSKFYVLWVLHI